MATTILHLCRSPVSDDGFKWILTYSQSLGWRSPHPHHHELLRSVSDSSYLCSHTCWILSCIHLLSFLFSLIEKIKDSLAGPPFIVSSFPITIRKVVLIPKLPKGQLENKDHNSNSSKRRGRKRVTFSVLRCILCQNVARSRYFPAKKKAILS